MDSLRDAGRLSSDDWQRLGELADHLEQAWTASGNADLGCFLPPQSDPLRPFALMELIKTDLEIRWRRRCGEELDYYVRRFPEMGPKERLPVALIYEEYRVRQRFGDRSALDSYRKRFPGRYDELLRVVQDQPVPTLPTHVHTQVSPGQSRSAVVAPQDLDSTLSIGSGYKREKLIGRGSFGEVWKATAPGGVPVAIKIIRRPADHEERQREERALEVVKNLTHHFLIRTHSFYEEQDRMFIVMDLAEDSLRERFRKCRLDGGAIPQAELLLYVKESAEALDYLHGKGVLHRDVKPDNILLVEGHVRLADFGMVKKQDNEQMPVSASGTPAYMSPEVWGGKPTRQSDQYSLAYTYAEMRLGRRPFAGTDFKNAMKDHLEKVPDLNGLPDDEQQVLLKALAKKPEDRFRSCREFVKALIKTAPPTDQQSISIAGGVSAAISTWRRKRHGPR